MKRVDVTRGRVAGTILVLWIAGITLLARRQFGASDAERLAKAAERIDPATYYYAVYQSDTPVGFASSAIDTSGRRLQATDYFRGRLVVHGTSRSIEVSSKAFLSRQFLLDSLVLRVQGIQQSHIIARQHPPGLGGAEPVLPPSILPVAFLLTDGPRIGRSRSYEMYTPATDAIALVTLRIAAESLFTVDDSAAYDSIGRHWVPAHSDTVRAWSIAPMTSGFTVWVDAQGRVVSAREPGGLHVVRMAYELAFRNWHLKHISKSP